MTMELYHGGANLSSNRPSYYAVIPASVRYDVRLPSTAKLLFGELTALASPDRTVMAGNGYFADLYKVSEKTISRLMADLENAGYLTTQLIRDPATKSIRCRIITLSVSILHGQIAEKPIDKNVQKVAEPTGQKCPDSGQKCPDSGQKCPDNNIYIKKKDKRKDDAEARQHLVAWTGTLQLEPQALLSLQSSIAAFLDTRIQVGKPMPTTHAANILIGKLQRLSEGNVGIMVQLLDEATERGWTSIYPLDGKRTAGKNPAREADAEWL